MAENLDVRERSKFSKICSVLVDIFFIPVLIFAFICAITLFSAKSNNKVPTLFGTSMVEVLSSSMQPEFKKGDLLTIKTVNKDNLVVGDAIAFYAPEQSGFTYGEGKPMVIYHQIIRIIYAKDDKGNNIRFFVCKGTNVSPKTEYVLIEPGSEGSKGDYRKDSNGNYISKKEDGTLASTYINEYNYVAKLLDDDVKADGDYDLDLVESQQMSIYQYVIDEMVVGVYSGRVNGVISSFVKLCTSSTGIYLLVIIPSLLMIVLIVMGMVKESKDAKSNAEKDRKVLNEALNFENEEKKLNKKAEKNNKESKGDDIKLDELKTNLDNKETKAKEIKSKQESESASPKVEEKVEQIKTTKTSQTSTQAPIVEQPKVSEVKQVKEEVKAAPKKVPTKQASKATEEASQPKVEPAKTKEQPKTIVPKKAPTVSNVETKPEPKVAPAKKMPTKVEVNEQPKAVPPKKAPAPAPITPKVEEAVKVAPKKAPAKIAPKIDETTKSAPKKVPPKKI